MSELAVYEKNLSRALNCPKPMRRRLLNRTREMVQDFLAGKPDAGWDEVADFLGDPQELAQTMLETADQEMLAQYRKKKLYFKRSVVGLLVVACIGMVSLLTYVLYVQATDPPVIATETFVIYEMEE